MTRWYFCSAGAMAVDVNSGRAFTINGLGNVSIGGAVATPSNAAYNGATLHLYQSGSSWLVLLFFFGV